MAETKPPFQDVTVAPVMLALLGAMQADLERKRLAVPASMVLQFGVAPVHDIHGDGDCDSEGWVRLVTGFPSTEFPVQNVELNTVPTRFGFTLEVGIIRCVVNLDENGEPPTVEERTLDALQILNDMASMRNAICACLSKIHTDTGREWSLGTYVPITDGALQGGQWNVTVEWMAGQ